MKTKKLMQYTAMSILISLTFSACEKDSGVLPVSNVVKTDQIGEVAKGPEINSAVNVTTQEDVPISARWFAHCANNGNGEYINVTGTIHVVVHRVINGISSHSIRISNYQNVKAIGETTGDQFEVIGIHHSINNVNRNTRVTVNLSFRRIVGPGPGSADMIRAFARGTITPDGHFRADWETSTLGCK